MTIEQTVRAAVKGGVNTRELREAYDKLVREVGVEEALDQWNDAFDKLEAERRTKMERVEHILVNLAKRMVRQDLAINELQAYDMLAEMTQKLTRPSDD